ncbi:MAG TPA: hypothetical protein VGP63_10700, partial [Planctomycetaceae bacterium]|nr:hypothetical protein [Planctomycetaceae bacterium]
MKTPMLIRACACLWLATAVPLAFAQEPPRDRRAFAEAMSKIKEGMTEAEVLALVGKPDDIRASGTWGASQAREWRYGVSQHLAQAMLGEVGIDGSQRVHFVSGQGAPPRDGLFTEPELRNLLQVIYDLGNRDQRYNPRSMIRAVNALQRL